LHAMQLTKAVSIFAALGDPVRLTIVARLCSDGPLPTITLKEQTSVSRQGVNKHLRLLWSNPVLFAAPGKDGIAYGELTPAVSQRRGRISPLCLRMKLPIPGSPERLNAIAPT
jgi:DNA-binding transcriptional ArsR family regulator